MKIHPTERRLTVILETLSPEYRVLLRHVLSCSKCRRAVLPELRRGGIGRAERPGATASRKILAWRPPEPSYEAVLERLFERCRQHLAAFSSERSEARTLLADLLGQTPERREITLANSPRFRKLALCELALEESRKRSLEDPSRGEELALLALRIAGLLDRRLYGRRVGFDLQARCWAYVGNARRMRSDLAGAEDAFERGKRCLEGSLDALEIANFMDFLASLRKDQRHFDEALKLRRQAISTYARFGDEHLLGRALASQASTFIEMGEPERALEQLREASKVIDPTAEPFLLLSVRHNLIYCLTDLDRFLEAQSMMKRSQALYRRFTETWTQSRRRWLEGRIAAGLGRLEEAEETLEGVRRSFLEQGIAYDLALVSLDLAAVYARRGRTARVRELASEMLPQFTSREIHREALAALAFFIQAAERETVTLETVREIHGMLRRSRRNPALSLRSEPPT